MHAPSMMDVYIHSIDDLSLSPGGSFLNFSCTVLTSSSKGTYLTNKIGRWYGNIFISPFVPAANDIASRFDRSNGTHTLSLDH